MADAQQYIVKKTVLDKVHDLDCLKGEGDKDCKLSADGMNTLNGVVDELLDDAAKRARLNGRVTIMPQDFGVLPKTDERFK